jgi:hypothetical protein
VYFCLEKICLQPPSSSVKRKGKEKENADKIITGFRLLHLSLSRFFTNRRRTKEVVVEEEEANSRKKVKENVQWRR